jgi:hypothetical protein
VVELRLLPPPELMGPPRPEPEPPPKPAPAKGKPPLPPEPPPGPPPVPPTGVTRTLVHEDCELVPTVQTAMLGDELVLTSTDPVPHIAHAFVGPDTYFRAGFPLKNKPVRQLLDRTGIVEITSDLGRRWMLAYVYVVPDQLAGVTDDTGAFRIASAFRPGATGCACGIPSCACWTRPRWSSRPRAWPSTRAIRSSGYSIAATSSATASARSASPSVSRGKPTTATRSLQTTAAPPPLP